MSDQEKKETVVPVESVDAQIKRLQLENLELERQAKQAALEAAQLEKQEREYHIKDLKGSIARRDLLEKQEQQNRESQGKTFAQDEATDKYRWSVCSHRKGGIVSARDMRALTTGGNEDQSAVIKHQMINGDIWVRCQRCGKTWSPPVESNFYFKNGKVVAPKDGVFDKVRFIQAQEEYMRAVNLPTRNTMSGSVQCRFLRYNPDTGKYEDAAEQYRENVKNTNLR